MSLQIIKTVGERYAHCIRCKRLRLADNCVVTRGYECHCAALHALKVVAIVLGFAHGRYFARICAAAARCCCALLLRTAAARCLHSDTVSILLGFALLRAAGRPSRFDKFLGSRGKRGVHAQRSVHRLAHCKETWPQNVRGAARRTSTRE